MLLIVQTIMLEELVIHFQGTAILCVYCQHRDTDLTITESFNRFSTSHNFSMILHGDFNVHHQEWLAGSHTSTASRSLREFCELNGLAQFVNTSTCGS